MRLENSVCIVLPPKSVEKSKRVPTCNGFIEVMKSTNLIGQEVNLGMDKEISIQDLAKLISKQLGSNKEIKTEEERKRPPSSEVERLRCNNNKIISLTNWRPKYSLEEALKLTIDWFLQQQKSGEFKSQKYNV